MPKDKILDEIRKILVPKLGKFVANSCIRVNCQRLGIKPEELTPSKLPLFAKKISVTLLLFLEEKEVEEVVKKIKNIK